MIKVEYFDTRETDKKHRSLGLKLIVSFEHIVDNGIDD